MIESLGSTKAAEKDLSAFGLRAPVVVLADEVLSGVDAGCLLIQLRTALPSMPPLFPAKSLEVGISENKPSGFPGGGFSPPLSFPPLPPPPLPAQKQAQLSIPQRRRSTANHTAIQRPILSLQQVTASTAPTQQLRTQLVQQPVKRSASVQSAAQ